MLKQKKTTKRKAASESEEESDVSIDGGSELDDEEVDFEDDDFDETFGNIEDEMDNVDEDLCEDDFVGLGKGIFKFWFRFCLEE